MKIIDGEKSLNCIEIKPESLAALSRDRMRILSLLAGEPMYPAQLARELKMQVQTVYYHMRLLEQAGLIKVQGMEEKGGAMAKRYAVAGDAIAAVLNAKAWRPFSAIKAVHPPSFFAPFIESGVFDGKMVLGSPDAHGKYRGRASEFCACELAMFLGNYCSFSFPLYYLDTELRETHKKNNLILIGGPKVNSLVAEVNPSLPIRFDEKTFAVHSTLSEKRYGENVGIIELVNSPFARGKKILFVGGMNYSSTRAAVLALVSKAKLIEKGNSFDSTQIARVVEGFDEDGDGIIDSVEFLE